MSPLRATVCGCWLLVAALVFRPDSGAGTSTPYRLVERTPLTAADHVLLGHRIDLNLATREQLQTLRGIGPALAERIVTYRTSKGAFPTEQAIQEVPGIGPKLYERMAPFITVTP